MKFTKEMLLVRQIVHIINYQGQGPNQLLTGGIYIMDGTCDSYRPFANLGNVGIRSIREQNGSFGPLHDNLQIDVVLSDND